jgi:hypothetical protein
MTTVLLDGKSSAPPPFHDDLFAVARNHLWLLAGARLVSLHRRSLLAYQHYLLGDRGGRSRFAVLPGPADDLRTVVTYAATWEVVFNEQMCYSQRVVYDEPLFPAAVDVGPDGLVYVLVGTTAGAAGDAPLIDVYDTLGDPVGHYSWSEVGVDPPPIATWPWAIDVSSAGVVLTTATGSGGLFRVHRLTPDLRRAHTLVGGQTRRERDLSPDSRQPLALAADGTGGLVVLDPGQAQRLRFTADGTPALVGTAPEGAVDLAVGADGAHYVSTSAGEVVRLAAGAVLTPTWRAEFAYRRSGRLAAAAGAVYVTEPTSRRVLALDRDSGAALPALTWPDAPGLWPTDVVAAPDGRLVTADPVGGRIAFWSAPTVPDLAWPAGVPDTPRRLAALELADGTAAVALLTADGFVQLHDAADGRLTSRWRPLLADGSALSASDIALDSTGRVLLADSANRAIRVFAPGGVPTPTPATAVPSPTPSGRTCLVTGDKVAAPATLVLGDTAAVTLTMSADCPAVTPIDGADIVFLLDRT